MINKKINFKRFLPLFSLVTVILLFVVAVNIDGSTTNSNEQNLNSNSDFFIEEITGSSTYQIPIKESDSNDNFVSDPPSSTFYYSSSSSSKSKSSKSSSDSDSNDLDNDSTPDSNNEENNLPDNGDYEDNEIGLDTNSSQSPGDMKSTSVDYETEDFVDVIVILKSDKIPEDTEIGLGIADNDDHSKDKLVKIKETVKIKQNEVLSKIDQDEFRLKYKYNTVNGFAGKITREGINKLEQDPDVEAIYEDEILSITLSESAPLINAPHAWRAGMTGEGSVVCILDTGIDYKHPDLGNPSCSIDQTTSGSTESYSLNSPHNYPNNYNNTWTITKSGYSNIAVHFDRIGLEKGSYDYIEILNSTNHVVQTIKSDLPWSTSHCEDMYDVWSISIPGDTIKIRLISDVSYTCYGFKVDEVLDGTVGYTWNNCGRVLDGYDFYNDDLDPMDDNSHGTHVAGIVAANGNIKGVAPDAELLAVKVCNAAGTSCPGSDMIAGVDWCNDQIGTHSVVATTMSIGDSGEYTSATCPTWLDSTINAAHSLGIAVTVASGNNDHSSGISYPACSPNAISVGSTTKSDVISSFTNTGNLLDFFAPGSSIRSTVLNGGYGYKSGTSMATPHVAGAIAVFKEYMPGASPDQMETTLKNRGILLPDPSNGLNFPRINMNFICRAHSDCGWPGFTGSPSCKDDNSWQDYTAYWCNNGGSLNSYCTSTDTFILKEECQHGCFKGECRAPEPECIEICNYGRCYEYCS